MLSEKQRELPTLAFMNRADPGAFRLGRRHTPGGLPGCRLPEASGKLWSRLRTAALAGWGAGISLRPSTHCLPWCVEEKTRKCESDFLFIFINS